MFLFQHVIDPTRHREGTQSTLLDLVLSIEEDDIVELAHKRGHDSN